MLSVEDLVDHQLGLTDSIPVSSLSILDRRFDIDGPFPIFEGKPTSFRMWSQAKKPCQLILTSQNGDFLKIPATITIPSLPGLPDNLLKIRIETWMLSVVVKNGETTDFKIEFSFDEPIALDKMIELFLILSWGQDGPIEYRLVGDSLPLIRGSMNIRPNETDPVFSNPLIIVKMLLDLTSRAGVTPPEFPARDISENWVACTRFHKFVTAQNPTLRFIPDDDSTYVEIKSLVGYVELELNSVAFMVLLEFPVLNQIIEGRHICLNFGAAILMECFVSDDIEVIRHHCQNSLQALMDQPHKKRAIAGNLIEVFGMLDTKNAAKQTVK